MSHCMPVSTPVSPSGMTGSFYASACPHINLDGCVVCKIVSIATVSAGSPHSVFLAHGTSGRSHIFESSSIGCMDVAAPPPL